MDQEYSLLLELEKWTREYPQLYEVGEARNTIANHLARILHQLDEVRKRQAER